MVTFTSIPENPYISLQDENLIIHVANKQYHFTTSEIKKMFLRQNVEYRVDFLEPWVFTPNTLYDLHIEMRQGRNVCLTVNAKERHYFIRLIYLLRASREFQAQEIQNLFEGRKAA